jgi:metal-sulfur cluster biosynthetic enzyme
MEVSTTGTTDVTPPGEVARPPHLRPLWDALREVMDPEIPVSLVDLGLIYDIRLDDGVVDVDLTFTATACPCMAFIRLDIEERLMKEEGVSSVRIHEVWDPPWTKDRITRAGREAMMKFGVSM